MPGEDYNYCTISNYTNMIDERNCNCPNKEEEDEQSKNIRQNCAKVLGNNDGSPDYSMKRAIFAD